MVKLKHDQAVLSDLRHFIQNIICEEGCMFIPVDELLGIMEEMF